MMLHMKQVKMTKFRYLPLVFNTNEPNYMNNVNVTIHRHNMNYENDEISTIATAFMTNEPNMV